MQIDVTVIISAGLSLFAALLVSFISTPLAKAFAKKVGAIDVPKDARRVHDHPIPRLGGLAIFLGFVIGVVLFAKIDTQLRGILLGSVVIVTVGVIDDITPLPALLKFGVQIIAALIAVAFGVKIDLLSNPAWWSAREYIDLGVFSIPLTVFWIVGVTNSVNLIDGLDGLAVGVSAIASMAMLAIALVLGQWNTTIVLAARRLLKGQNPMSPDRGHFHHRLIDMGLSQKQAVAILYAISAILGLSAVLIATSGEMKAIVLVFSFCVAISIGVALTHGHKHRKPEETAHDAEKVPENNESSGEETN